MNSYSKYDAKEKDFINMNLGMVYYNHLDISSSSTYNYVIVVVMEYLSKACRLKDSHNHKRGIYSLHGSLIGSR